MAVDIAPEILNDIMDSFEEAWHDNKKLPGLMDKLKNGTATYAEANEYAAEVGRMMKEAYAANLSSDRLPDGKCYYNIADRIIRETEHMQYVRVSDYAMKVQLDLNKKAGIGLKAIAPEEDTGLVQSLINKAANADQYDDVAAYVSQTMESMSKKVVDHSIKANADFQYKAGMRPKIIRSGGSGCCEWCSGLSGKYDYPDVPSEVYARHNNCTCTVEYVPGDGKRQDVWSKNWISEEEAQRREELKTLGLDNSDKYAKIEYRKNIKSEAEKNAEKRANYEKNATASERGRKLHYGKEESFSRVGQTVNAREVKNFSSNRIYLANDVKLSTREVRWINDNVSEAKMIMGISKECNIPIVIVNDDSILASYNPVTDVMYVSSNLSSDKKILELQQGFAASDNTNSTAVHELIHWKDAENYRKNIGIIASAEPNSEYTVYQREQAIKELKKAGVNIESAEEIKGISEYSYRKWLENDYEEVYTEWRTKERIGG